MFTLWEHHREFFGDRLKSKGRGVKVNAGLKKGLLWELKKNRNKEMFTFDCKLMVL